MCNLRRHAVNSGLNMEKGFYCGPRRRHLIEVIYFYLEDKTLFCEIRGKFRPRIGIES